MKRDLIWGNVARSAGSGFCAAHNFSRNFSISISWCLPKSWWKNYVWWSMSVKSSVKWVFQMVLSVYLLIVEKELRTLLWSSNFRDGTLKELPLQWQASFSSTCAFLLLVLNRKIKMKTEYHSIFITFKR